MKAKIISVLLLIILLFTGCDTAPEKKSTTHSTEKVSESSTEKVTESTARESSSSPQPTTEPEFDENFSSLILVNPTHPIPDGYVDSITLTKVQDGYKVDSRCAEFLKRMIKAAEKDGVDLMLCSAFRTYARQKELYNNRIRILKDRYPSMSYEEVAEMAKTINAYPGTSEHELGLAVDIVTPGYTTLNSGFDKTKAFKWLKEHCAEYGFIMRYPKDKKDITHVIYEPWHYRFVGLEYAAEITDAGVTLEEYLGVLD